MFKFNKLLSDHKKNFSNFFNNIDKLDIEFLVDILKSKNGIFYFSGVGKSGISAKYFSDGLNSIGIKSFFVCPFNSLHGGLGVFNKNDYVFVFSKDGENKDILFFAQNLIKKGSYIILITSNVNSPLAEISNKVISLHGNENVNDNYNIPVFSVPLQTLFASIVISSLKIEIQLSEKEYRKSHPR